MDELVGCLLSKSITAIGKFKKVVAEYPNSPESIEAVATARLIYVDNGGIFLEVGKGHLTDCSGCLRKIVVVDVHLDVCICVVFLFLIRVGISNIVDHDR